MKNSREDQINSTLDERVKKLEQVVEQLAVQVESVLSSQDSKPVSPVPPPPPVPTRARQDIRPIAPSVTPPQPDKPAFTLPEHMRSSEYWLNKIGIGLLLFGAVFLFKYSVDQGWLTPTIRVLIGLALGAGLSVIGLRLHKKRKHFSQVLLGGSIATFYITGFSAFQLFNLVPYPVAFAFFIAVTIYSFALSLYQNEFIFSLIAIIGGLGTPFLLYTGESSVPGLMLYWCVLMAGASGIYFFKGWWSFFWTSCIGGWTVILIAIDGEKSFIYAPTLDKIAIQTALFLALPFFWLVPLGRELALAKKPELLGEDLPKAPMKKTTNYQPNLPELNVNFLTIVTSFLSIYLSSTVWNWQDITCGAVGLSMAVIVAAIGWTLNIKTELKSFAYTHLVVSLILLTVALYYFFDGSVLLVAVTLEAAAIHLVKIKIDNKSLAPLAHTLFGIVGFCLLSRIFNSRHGTTLINAQALSDLIIPASAFGLCRFFKEVREKQIYLLAGFAALAGILLRELEGNIEFLVLAAEAVALLYLAYRLKNKILYAASHLANALMASWLMVRLFESVSGNPVFNFTALTDIVVIAAVALATLFLTDTKEKLLYLLVGHVVLLLWFLRELSPLANGQGLVSVAWGIYTVSLFIVGLRKDLKVVTKTAMATLLVLVGKLFLVDLANLATLWRVLLFMGFGAVLLFLSYYFQSLWKTKKG